MQPEAADFERDVFPAELEEIAARRNTLRMPPAAPANANDADGGLVGLSVSGGGIRSATFNLGAIQALHRHRAFQRFDYLSTVSGGGFIGGCVSSLLNDPALRSDDDTFPLREIPDAPDVPAVRHLRNSGNYLAPGGMVDRIRIAALLVRGVLLNLFALTPYLMFAVLATQYVYDSNLTNRYQFWWAVALFALRYGPFLFFLLVLSTFPIVSTLIGNRLSWAGRDRYERLLAYSFTVFLFGLVLNQVFDVIGAASDLSWSELVWWTRETVVSTTFLKDAGIAVAGLAAIAFLTRFSASATKARGALVLYALGLLGPSLVAVAYLLLCIAYIEPRVLNTVLSDNVAVTAKAVNELDEGTLPVQLAKIAPRPPRMWRDRALPAEGDVARGTVNGRVYRMVSRDGTEGLWLEADVIRMSGDEREKTVAALNARALPDSLSSGWFQVNSDKFTLKEAIVGVTKNDWEWSVKRKSDKDTFAITRDGDTFLIFWVLPVSQEPGATRLAEALISGKTHVASDDGRLKSAQFTPQSLGHLARLKTVEQGSSWHLTSGGRDVEIHAARGRFLVRWDLAANLDRRIVTDPLRSAFDSKGGLPEAVAIGGEPGEWLLTYPSADGTGGFAVVTRPGVAYETTKRPPFMDGVLSKMFLGFAVFTFFLNILVLNANASSVHGFYRDRLSKAYLLSRAASGPFHFDQNDQQKLTTLNQPRSTAPYHLINVSLNLNGLTEPDMRGRQADFFIFSKRYTGSVRTGYCDTASLEKRHRHLNLGTAMAISGAAASPNAGMTTVKPLVFLLTLLNIRLGYWMPHPAFVAGPWWRRARLMLGVGTRYLWREATGSLTGAGPYVNLSDGGHIENLGLMSLLKRRCKVIVALDAEQDEALRFGSLIQLMMYARVDLGVDIDIDLSAIRPTGGRSTSHFAVGTIDYSNGDKGYLVYVKASMTGDEDVLLQDYRELHADFPHQSTANQFFDERQFEMYRALGEHIVEDVCVQLLSTCKVPLGNGVQQAIAQTLFGAKGGAVVSA